MSLALTNGFMLRYFQKIRSILPIAEWEKTNFSDVEVKKYP